MVCSWSIDYQVYFFEAWNNFLVMLGGFGICRGSLPDHGMHSGKMNSRNMRKLSMICLDILQLHFIPQHLLSRVFTTIAQRGSIAHSFRVLSTVLLSLCAHGFPLGPCVSSNCPKIHAGRWTGYSKFTLDVKVCANEMDWRPIQGKFSCRVSSVTGIGSDQDKAVTQCERGKGFFQVLNWL